MESSPPNSSVHGILQARILEWLPRSSRGSSWSRDRTKVSWVSCIAGRFLIAEPPEKPQLTAYMWVNFWVLYTVSLIYVSIYNASIIQSDYPSFVIHFKIRKCDTSRLALLAQDYFSYLGFFVVPYEFWNCFSISVSNAIGIFIGIALNLQLALGNMNILSIINPFNPQTQTIFPFVSSMFFKNVL